MATRQVTAAELNVIDHEQFMKEYWEWCNYAIDYDWTDFIKEDFVRDMAPFGVRVADIHWDDVGYSASAAMSGVVNLWTFMETYKVDDVPLSELYPALYLAVKHDESFVRVRQVGRGLRMGLDFYENTQYLAPLGIFSALDEAPWQELVEDQWKQSGIARGTLDDFLKDKCGDLARNLDAEYEHLTSVESFMESCEINEVTFEIEIDEEENEDENAVCD